MQATNPGLAPDSAGSWVVRGLTRSDQGHPRNPTVAMATTLAP
jgi:hypothetical protein